jgi:C1A family cysteine protease
MGPLPKLVVFILIFWIAFGLCQEVDETQAPQKIQELIKDLRLEIQDEGYSFTVGYNPALNYTLSQLCGLKEPADWWQKAKDVNISKLKPATLSAVEEEEVGLPAQWDWRDHNGVTEVRDQQACGSCWAFGTIASFESLLLIKQNLLTDLSEQFLVSCNNQDWGCNGGWWAHDMLVDSGAVLEEDFPTIPIN